MQTNTRDLNLTSNPTQRTPLEALVMLERAEMVREVMSRIPKEQTEVMHLAYFSGYSQSQIADHLGLPLGTVKTRMRQGMIKLQSLLSKNGS